MSSPPVRDSAGSVEFFDETRVTWYHHVGRVRAGDVRDFGSWPSAPTRSRRSIRATPTSMAVRPARSIRWSTRRDDDGARLVDEPLGVRPVGDVHGDGESGSAGGGYAERHGEVLGRGDRAWHGVLVSGQADVHDFGSGRRHPLDHGAVSGRRQLQRQYVAALSQMVNRRDHDDAGLVDEPVGVRPGGHVHGDGESGRAGGGHGERAR